MMYLTAVAMIALVLAFGALWRIASQLMRMVTQLEAQRADDLSTVHRSLSDALTSVARAVGESVQTAMAPPPPAPETREQMIARAAHELATDPALEDVDDTDPTDAWITPPDRPDATIVSRNDDMPFGVPGVHFPTVPDDLAAITTLDPNG